MISNVICSRTCKYRNDNFCGLPYTHINAYGVCEVWYEKNGQPRQLPYDGFGGGVQKVVVEEKNKPETREENNGENAEIGEKSEN